MSNISSSNQNSPTKKMYLNFGSRGKQPRNIEICPSSDNEFCLRQNNDLQIVKNYIANLYKCDGQDKKQAETQNTDCPEHSSRTTNDNSRGCSKQKIITPNWFCLNIKNVKYKIAIEINNNEARLKSISDYKLLETIIKIWERENRDLINNRYTDAFQEKYDDTRSASNTSRAVDDEILSGKGRSSGKHNKMDDILVDLDREECIVNHLVHDTSESRSAKDLQVDLPNDRQNSPEVVQEKLVTPTLSERFREGMKSKKDVLQGHSIHSKESAIIVFNKDNISDFKNYVDAYQNQSKSIISASHIQKSDRPSEFTTNKKKSFDEFSEKVVKEKPVISIPKKSNYALCGDKVLQMCMNTNKSKTPKSPTKKKSPSSNRNTSFEIKEIKSEETNQKTGFIKRMTNFLLCNW